MKRILRAENLLFLPLVITSVVIGYQFSSEYVFGESKNWGGVLLYVILVSNFMWLVILFPAYLVHYMLRAINRRNRALCFAHVILSIALMVWFYSEDIFATSVVPGWHTTIYPPLSGLGPFFPGPENLLFIALQLTFLIYGIVIIRRWKNNRPE